MPRIALVLAVVLLAALSVATATAEKREHYKIRWVIYQREHRRSTRLGERVRTLQRQAQLLRQELKARHVQAVQQPQETALPSHYQQWLCIHGYEGAWDAHTGNGYYGGLQMDKDFQQAYGSALLQAKGTADHWTPLEQMQVAERAYESGRGFYPWPNTAHMCGLI